MLRPLSNHHLLAYWRRATGVLLGLVFVGAGLHASTASARPAKPQLHLTLPLAGGDAGLSTPYTWSARDARSGTLVLQRQVGTASVWRTITRLHGSSGRGRIRRLPLGSYQLRIADIGPGPRHKLLAQQRRLLRVYGRVPLGDFLVSGVFAAPAGGGVFSMPTGTFSWIATTEPRNAPRTLFSVQPNRCRRVHIDFVTESRRSDANTLSISGVVTILQETADPVSASVPQLTVGDVDAALVPGKSWSMNAAVSGDDYNITLYFNGYVSCYDATPAAF
jgi:hypothetical protein